jgi:hypothetical protein
MRDPMLALVNRQSWCDGSALEAVTAGKNAALEAVAVRE